MHYKSHRSVQVLLFPYVLIVQVFMKFLQPIIALLQFTTIIPFGKMAPFEAFSRNVWLYPVAGYVTGGIAGLILYLLPAPSLVSAVIGLSVVLFLTGCNHLDGLLDLGDGLMAHGGRDIRIRALTDQTIGTGGIALGLLTTLFAWSSLASIHQAFFGIILAEVGGKYAMAVMTVFGRPFHDGLHKKLHQYASPWFILLSTILLLPLLFLPLPWISLGFAMLVMIMIPAGLIILASALFGGVNGDVTGAAGEITRAGVLAVIACTAGSAMSGGILSLV